MCGKKKGQLVFSEWRGLWYFCTSVLWATSGSCLWSGGQRSSIRMLVQGSMDLSPGAEPKLRKPIPRASCTPILFEPFAPSSDMVQEFQPEDCGGCAFLESCCLRTLRTKVPQTPWQVSEQVSLMPSSHSSVIVYISLGREDWNWHLRIWKVLLLHNSESLSNVSACLLDSWHDAELVPLDFEMHHKIWEVLNFEQFVVWLYANWLLSWIFTEEGDAVINGTEEMQSLSWGSQSYGR